MNRAGLILAKFTANCHKNGLIDPHRLKILLAKADRKLMMWKVWLKRSIISLLGLFSILIIANSVAANAPKPPSLYWLKFNSPAQLQGIQIAQCQGKDCQKLALLKQFGTCDRSGCIKSQPKLDNRKPLSVDCADRLCLISLSPFYDVQKLDPSQIRLLAQLENQVYVSKVFSLKLQERHHEDKFTVKAIGKTLELLPSPEVTVIQSSLFQNLALFFLFLTLGIELGIWAGYLRYHQVQSAEIRLTIISLLIAHAFSFPIVWFSASGLAPFASDGVRYGGLTWLALSILHGIILSLHSIWAKTPFSSRIVIGSIAYWLGAAVFTMLLTGLSGYGSPVPTADGLAQPIPTILSEVFVVGYEAWIVQRIRRDTLNFRTALSLSLVANTVSCLLGLAWEWFGSM